MLCEKCGKNIATTHIKTSINGVVEAHHLCADCAKHNSYVQNQFGLENLLGSFFDDSVKSTVRSDKRKRCEGCGLCFDDIAKTGRVGCDKCYDTFFEQLLPSLQRMHGKAYHAGKRPLVAVEQPAVEEDRLEQLKAELKQAIEEENFEQAAALRDMIKKEQREADSNE